MIVELLGTHSSFVEPYFGSGAVLFAKPRSKNELVNDLDGDVINFYMVLRDRAEELVEACLLTPCAEGEWRSSREPLDELDPLERARLFFVRSNQSFGSAANGGWIPMTGGNDGLGRKWVRALGRLGGVAERLQGVQVSCRDALDVLNSAVGSAGAAIYLDPPYLEGTVTKGNHYRQRDGLTVEHHEAMLDLATRAVGTVVVSHYTHPLYEEKLEGWHRSVVAVNHTGNPKTETSHEFRSEVLWVNREPLSLF